MVAKIRLMVAKIRPLLKCMVVGPEGRCFLMGAELFLNGGTALTNFFSNEGEEEFVILFPTSRVLPRGRPRPAGAVSRPYHGRCASRALRRRPRARRYRPGAARPASGPFPADGIHSMRARAARRGTGCDHRNLTGLCFARCCAPPW